MALAEVLKRAENQAKLERLQRQQQLIQEELQQLQKDEDELKKISLPKLKEIPKKPKNQPIEPVSLKVIESPPPLLTEKRQLLPSIEIVERMNQEDSENDDHIQSPNSPSESSDQYLGLEVPSTSLLSGTSLLKLKKGILKNKKKRGPRKEPPKKCRLCSTDDVFIRPHRIFMVNFSTKTKKKKTSMTPSNQTERQNVEVRRLAM